MRNLHTNEDGLTQRYGKQWSTNNLARKPSTAGSLKEIVLDFSYDWLAAYDEGDGPTDSMDRFGGAQAFIPEGAHIAAVFVIGRETFDEDVVVGLYEKDGTVIDADGLVVATSFAAGTSYEGAGALVGTVATEDSYIVVDAAIGAPTEGEARLIVKYFD